MKIRSLIIVFLIGMISITTAHAQTQDNLAVVLTIDGPILSPILKEYIRNGLEEANRENAQVVILELNTPGGSIDLTQELVEIIRASDVPVVVYVSPPGAIAGSAGTIITLAGHVAAMAPETAIGAASPVTGSGEDIEETLETKIKEILKAQVRSLAENRPPEAIELAEETIENAIAVSATEALDVGLVDLIADDRHDLLGQLDGLTIPTASGERTIHVTNPTIQEIPPSLIEELLTILTDANIVFLLLILGVQAILIELRQPGGWIAGFIGVVALSLATYGLGILPVNWFGIIFLITAFVLFYLEVHAPTHGALTITGLASLIVGALVLFNSPGTPEFMQVSIPLVVISSLLTAGAFMFLIAIAVRALQSPAYMGQSALIGKQGIVKQTIPKQGKGEVQIGGELWSAELSQPGGAIEIGQRVEVISVEGIRLKVRSVTRS